METQITEQNIQKLVHTFYSKVRADDALAPIFIGAIGNSENQWGPHLQKMCQFWSSMMLRTNSYQGTPFQKHMALPAFDLSLFDRWLLLFEQTAHEIFAPETALLFIRKSQLIAESLKAGLARITPKHTTKQG